VLLAVKTTKTSTYKKGQKLFLVHGDADATSV